MSATATPESPATIACVQFSVDDLLALGRLSRIVHGVDVARQNIRGIFLRSARSDGWGRAVATDGRVLSVARICRPGTSTALHGPTTTHPIDLSPWDRCLIPYAACEWLRAHCGTLAACRRVLGDVSLRGPGPGRRPQIVLGDASHNIAWCGYPDYAPLAQQISTAPHYQLGPYLSGDVATLVEAVATPPKGPGKDAKDPVCPSPRSSAYGAPAVYLTLEPDILEIVTIAMPLALETGAPGLRVRRAFAEKFPPASAIWSATVAAILDGEPYTAP